MARTRCLQMLVLPVLPKRAQILLIDNFVDPDLEFLSVTFPFQSSDGSPRLFTIETAIGTSGRISRDWPGSYLALGSIAGHSRRWVEFPGPCLRKARDQYGQCWKLGVCELYSFSACVLVLWIPSSEQPGIGTILNAIIKSIGLETCCPICQH